MNEIMNDNRFYHITTFRYSFNNLFYNIKEGNLKTIEPCGLKQWKHNSQ
jgi:hypothetical protein